jgi:hypothetical protein
MGKTHRKGVAPPPRAADTDVRDRIFAVLLIGGFGLVSSFMMQDFIIEPFGIDAATAAVLNPVAWIVGIMCSAYFLREYLKV